jgi:pyruvate dehydrogenase E2 component (dihydrolipoamide acetyltransferase)
MPVEVVVPEVGEAGMDVRFVGWLKQEGDEVRAGDPLFELDTDKATMDVEAFAEGTLTDLRVQADDVVRPRQVVALLLAEGETLPGPETAPPREDTAVAAEQLPTAAPGPRAGSSTAGAAGGRGEVRAMPRAKALARARGIDLASLTGSGPGGAVTVSDVESASAGAGSDGEGHRAPRVRRAVAKMTSESWRSVPHFHLTLQADVTEAFELLRPMVAICATITRALERHPECNLEWRDGDLVRRDRVDLGILVDTAQGLLLPAVRDAGSLDGDALGGEIREAAERARAGTLRHDDHGARSVSVSNLGMFAVDSFAGVIAAPDILLLSAGRAATRALLIDGEWRPRRVATLTLSVDHRALDGADGGRLLTTVEELLRDAQCLA